MSPSVCQQCGAPLAGDGDEACPRCLMTVFLSHDRAEEPLAGVRFGEYELRERIAVGGMGIVYQAWHTSLHRMVALKMLKSGRLADAAERQRFAVEAEAVAQLHHAGIVPIYEVGEHDDQPFYTMRLVEGGRSGAILSQALPVDFRRVAATLVEVARAVHYAHQRGILHRDLKPANILLDEAGNAFIVDFGLAKFTDANSGLTVSGAVLGTPAYMAPEVAAGGSRAATVAADVYSLGTLLYEWTTGRPPFAAETTLEMLRKIAQEEPPPPSTFNASLPRDVETICLKCLQKQPDKRYLSAAALADDLDRWLRGEPITARPVSTWERAVRWSRRRPALAALIAVSVAAVAAFVFQSQFANRRLAKEASLSREAESKALASRREARESAYFSQVFAACQAFHDGDFTLARRLLKKQEPAEPGGEDFRGLEWHLISKACEESEPLWSITAHGPVTSLAAAPDHEYVLAVDGTGVHAWRLSDHTPADELLPVQECSQVLSSPDDKWVAFATAEHGITIWDWKNRKPLAKLPGGNGGMAVSGDGQRLLVRTLNGKSGAAARLYDAATWLPRPDFLQCGSPFALNHDGSCLAETPPGENGRIMDIGRGVQVCTFDGGHGAMSFNKDGSLIASSGSGGRILVHNTRTGIYKRRFEAVGEALYALAWIGGGEYFAAGGSSHVIKLFSNTDAVRGTANPKFSHHHKAVISSLAWNRVAGSAPRLLSGSRDGTIIYHDILTPQPEEDRDLKLGPPLLVFPGSSRFMGILTGDKVAPGKLALCEAATCKVLDEYDLPPDAQPFGPWQEDGSAVFLQTPAAGVASILRIHTETRARDNIRLRTTVTDRTRYAASAGAGLVAILATPGRITLHDGHKGTQTGDLQTDINVIALQLSPAGDVLYEFSADSWSARALPGGARLWHAAFPGTVLHKTFCNAGATLLAAALKDGTIQLFSCRDGKSIRQLTGHNIPVESCAFTPDDTRLVTTAGLSDVKMWELHGGTEIVSLMEMYGLVRAVAITGDGQYLLRSSAGGTLIWPSEPWNAAMP